MTQHTPGPWAVEIDTHQAGSDWYAAAIGTGSPWDGTHRTLARVRQAEHSYDEAETARAEADARLIAAAPTMYEALLAQERVSEHGQTCEVCTDIETNEADVSCAQFTAMWDHAEALRDSALSIAMIGRDHTSRQGVAKGGAS